MYTIGIGITTRNRPELLTVGLPSFIRNTQSMNTKLIVVDDSDPEYVETNKYLSEEYGFHYFHDGKRKGVAGAKNACLSYLKGCDFIFLFDDDGFPIKFGWDSRVILAHFTTGIHHFNLLDEILHGVKSEYTFDTGNGEPISIVSHNNLGGVMLFLTNDVVESVGAFNPKYGIYGFEHCSYTARVERAGFHKGFGLNLSIKGMQEYVIALDHSKHESNCNHHLHKEYFSGTFVSSMETSKDDSRDKTQQYINDNFKVFSEDVMGPVFISLDGIFPELQQH